MSSVGKRTFPKDIPGKEGPGRGLGAPRAPGQGCRDCSPSPPQAVQGKALCDSHPPVMPGQPRPRGHAIAGTQSWDTQADQRRLQATGGAPIPLPPPALLRWPWQDFVGSFSSSALAKACLFTWRQTFNEDPSMAGIIILCSRNRPHYLLLILDRVFPAQRINIRNPSPDVARRSAGVVQKGLKLLGLNIDHDARRRRKQEQESGRGDTRAVPRVEGSCLYVLPAPACTHALPARLGRKSTPHCGCSHAC